MAADVGAMERKRDLVTYDLLGGSPAIGSNGDLDLSSKVTSGCQNHGTVPTRRAGSQGLHLPPGQGASGLELKLTGPGRVVPSGYASVCTLDKVKSALERARRVSPRNPPPAAAAAASRQRASGRGSRNSSNSSSTSSSTTSSVTSSSSIKRPGARHEEPEDGADGCDSSPGAMTAAGCPRCLMYVLISKASPRCPRCDSPVAVPVLQKRPRIDLNFSL